MGFSRLENFFVVIIMLAVLSTGLSFLLKDSKIFFDNQPAAISNAIYAPSSDPKGTPLSSPPEIIKAVYVTGYSAGSRKYLDYLANIFKTTEINAVVVDIKDYSGFVSYNSDALNVKKYSLYNGAVKDINALLKFFHDQNIYVIGRIAVFEDPGFAKARPDLAVYNKLETADFSKPVLWQDNKNLSWVDPASKDIWDYNISLAKDAFLRGFDEINFDYVRFPTDGKKESMGFPVWDGKIPMAEIIKEFFNYTRRQLSGEKLSVDLFGLTTVNKNDMGIGQVIEDAFENFDYISPMVYPSHYANGFIGFSNPAEHPYEVIKYSLDSALNREKIILNQQKDLAIRNSEAKGSPAAELQSLVSDSSKIHLAKFRPWLQDFNMGADYTADMVKAEIKATQDALKADYNGFMLWNPSNVYTVEAILKPN